MRTEMNVWESRMLLQKRVERGTLEDRRWIGPVSVRVVVCSWREIVGKERPLTFHRLLSSLVGQGRAFMNFLRRILRICQIWRGKGRNIIRGRFYLTKKSRSKKELSACLDC